MSGEGIAQIVFYAVVLVALGYPLGLWMARVYTCRASRTIPRVGRARLLPPRPRRRGADEQDWKGYGKTVLVFSVLFSARPLRDPAPPGPPVPEPRPHEGACRRTSSLNTAASFITNTNWQFYGGEYTMSYLTQMAGLAVQNFVSAAVGIAVLAAVVRGIARRSAGDDRQLLASTSTARSSTCCCRCRSSSPSLLIWQGVAADASTATRRRRRSRAPTRRSRAARSPRRSRSSSSARTAAASTTRTRPCRSRTRPASRTSSRCSRSC